MRLIKLSIAGLISLLGLVACESEDPLAQSGFSKPVVEAFISAEADTIQVNITEMIPYLGEEGDTLAKPISNLEVFLVKNGGRFIMTEKSEDRGVYFILPQDINLEAGDSLSFESTVEGFSLSGSTWIPPKPTSVKISDDVLYYEAGNPRGMLNTSNLIVSWDNPTDGFFYVSMKNIEANPQPVNEMFEDAPVRSQAPPSQADQFEIRFRNLMYFGTYQVILFHVNQEFANLFDNPTMNSVNITEPPTNIENGLGIFTGISADTLYFDLRKK
ncbi:MAG: DUF4249 family protein [Bacteroidales bacterium]|nr:DUF4249 family protein [Bacteroidales bacterium]